MQADAARPAAEKRYTSIASAFSKILEKSGVRGLYTGITPTVQRAALVAALEIGSYDHFKQLLAEHWGLSGRASSTHLMAATCASSLCSLLVAPIDFAKSRVMNAETNITVLGALHGAVRAEGALSVWKGVTADFMRRGPHCVISFLVLEQLKLLTGL
jgi:Mitochondrial carrier protein